VLQYVQPQLEQLFGREALFRDGLVVTTTLDLDLQQRSIDRLETEVRADPLIIAQTKWRVERITRLPRVLPGAGPRPRTRRLFAGRS